MACSVSHKIQISAGNMADYAALKGFHYRDSRPGVVMRIFAARYSDPEAALAQNRSIAAGVVVESLPALGCALRAAALPGVFDVGDRALAAAKLNREMRTISRVIVHPMFRGTGLAVALVRHVLVHAETRCVEALAAMGRVNPFFRRAGMREFDRPPLPEAVRFAAALAYDGMQPLDLVDADASAWPGFLRKELRRFAGMGTVEEQVAKARHRLLSQPVYYVWDGMNAECEMRNAKCGMKKRDG